jgi:hypothetical protein
MNNQYTAMAIGSVITALVVTAPAQAQSVALTQLFPALVGVELQPDRKASLEQLSQQTLPSVRGLLSPGTPARAIGKRRIIFTRFIEIATIYVGA